MGHVSAMSRRRRPNDFPICPLGSYPWAIHPPENQQEREKQMTRHIKAPLITYIDQHIGPNPSKDPKALLVQALMACKGVHEEHGNNNGAIVQLFQSTVGSPVHQAWCMDFQESAIAYVEQKLGVTCPLPATESTIFMADWAKKNGCLEKEPVVGDQIIWSHPTGGGHVGFILKTGDILETIEGNTSAADPAVVREGDCVAVKLRSPKGSASMHVLGFVPVTFSAAKA